VVVVGVVEELVVGVVGVENQVLSIEEEGLVLLAAVAD
jgi:hypothetical protein